MIAEKLLNLDRRIIFALIAVAVGAPLVFEIPLNPGKNRRSQAVFEYVEDLDEGAIVVIVFDYGPGSMPELNPMARAIAWHALSRDLRVVGLTLVPDAPILADGILKEVGDALGKESGVDYVNLGFRPGFVAVVLGMASDIGRVFETDFEGRPFASLEATRGLRNYDDIALLVDLASSATPEMWILYAHQDYGATVAAGVTAVMAQDHYPYLQTGQLIGLLNGLKGAAEYEALVDAPGDAMLGMAAQSFSQFLIIGLVILGNICYFTVRRRGRVR